MPTPDAQGHERLSSNRVQVSAFCALTGLCLGVSMSYVPYLFGAPGFRLIYENVRLLGLAFLLGGGLLAFATIAPRDERWAGSRPSSRSERFKSSWACGCKRRPTRRPS